jgi:uncharacterized protein YndB with AHSA1/START domain
LHIERKARTVPERIEREILIDAPREVVWSIITEPRHVAGWFGDSAEIALRPGGAAAFTWNKGGADRGEGGEYGTRHARVEQVDPPRTFAFRWARELGAEPTPGASTLVEFHLTPVGEGTLLRVIESGFRELEWPEEDNVRYVEGNREGWELELGQLRDYVAEQVRGTSTS